MVRLPLLGFPSPVAPSAWEVYLTAKFCLLRSVPPPGFLNLLTAYSSQCLVALFHATGTRWVIPSELCSFARSRAASRRPLPSCRSPSHTSTRRIVTSGWSRLQGFAPLESPARDARWLGWRRPVALLGLCPSRVTHSARRKGCFHPLPLLSFTARRLPAPAVTPGVSRWSCMAGLRRDCRPLWGFLTS